MRIKAIIRKIRPNLLYVVIAVLALGLAFIVYRGNIDLSKSGASDDGYGYGIPRGKLSYSKLGWNSTNQTWVVEITYGLENVENGSLKKGQNTIIKNNISSSGSIFEELPPRSRTVYSLYPLPNGQGRQLDELTVILPAYGY